MALGAIVPAVLVPFWGPVRRRLVEPRTGFVEFSTDRASRNQRLLVASIGLGVLLLALFLAAYFWARPAPGELAQLLIPGLPAALIGLLMVLIGLGLGLPRFIAYAGIFCGAGLWVAVADARPEVAMIAGGVAVLLYAAVLLRRLLKLEPESGESS